MAASGLFVSRRLEDLALLEGRAKLESFPWGWLARIPYGCPLLPSHLCEDLDLSKTCQCGRACLRCFIQTTETMNLHSVAHSVVLVDNMGGTEAPILRYFCSLTCYSQFLDRRPPSPR